MKKRTKVIMSIIAVITLIFNTVGCAKVSVPLNAGYALPYDTLESIGEINYDASKFYLNEQRISGADPFALYYTSADISDSYDKIKADKLLKKETDEAGFIAKYGTKEDWLAKYGDKYYMTNTGGYIGGNDDSTFFRLFSSDDFVNWKLCGSEGGNNFVRESGTWMINANAWAPELFRDSESGYFFLAFSVSSVGHDTYDYLQQDSGGEYLALAISDTPVGPYKTVSAERYYSTMCDYDENGNVKTIEKDGKTYALKRESLGGGILTEYVGGEFLNKNGERVTVAHPPININYYCKDELLKIYSPEEETGFTALHTIDAHPFVDSCGNLFMYFTVEGGGIYVIQMRDWLSPMWETFTRVTAIHSQTVFNTDSGFSSFVYKNDVRTSTDGLNEGETVVEKDGFFYLFYSRQGMANPAYNVHVAVADNPFGPFVKLHDINPVIGLVDGNDDMVGTGHCAIVNVGGEYWCIYCANDSYTSSNRSIAMDKILFKDYANITFNDIKESEIAHQTELQTASEEVVRAAFDTCNHKEYERIGNANGLIALPYGNGPTYFPQLKPNTGCEFRNVAEDDDVKVEVLAGDKDSAKYACDGLFTTNLGMEKYETTAKNELKIKISFEKAKEVSAILIYPSRDYGKAIDSIASIVFELDEKPSYYPSGAKYNGYCHIENLAVNTRAFNDGGLAIRCGYSANAVFEEIKVKSITVTVQAKDRHKDAYGDVDGDPLDLALSEITIVGRGE